MLNLYFSHVLCHKTSKLCIVFVCEVMVLNNCGVMKFKEILKLIHYGIMVLKLLKGAKEKKKTKLDIKY